VYRETNIQPYLFDAEDTVRLVLDRFNLLDHQIGLVVDADGQLTGTVTDGDLRRGFLRQMTLEDPILECATRKPLVIRSGEAPPSDAMAYSFVPEIDDTGRPIAILLPRERDEISSDCLVMAGGHGSRMGELTRNCPKPLLPLGDKPILEHVLLGLEKAGHRRIFLSTHYLADQVERFASERTGKAELALVHEETKLGTAGAVGLLPEGIRPPLLVLNGDVVTQTDFRAMRDFHDQLDHDATIGVARYEIEIPFGVVQHSADGIFTRIEEKPTISQFVAAGIYLLSEKALNLAPKNRHIDMPELLNSAAHAGLRIGVFPIHEYWKDVGRQTDLRSATDDYNQVK